MSKHRTRKTTWNRLLSGVLCLALALGLLPASGLVQTAEAHWADPYGEQLVEWGVINPSTNLRLDSTITRAEFAAMCNRAFGYTKLGENPFIDVNPQDWYYEDINIAYNAGYFMGAGGNRALPNETLSREQATVLVARNLMLQETVGEVLGFTDNHSLSDWSRGLIGAAVAEGMITSLPDGSFSPTNDITRGEVAAMLVRVIGTPISKAGDYELGGVYGNVMISSSNVTLRNTTIAGNLYVTGGVDLGNILLENVTVLGRIVVSGGGESHSAQSSVVLRNVAADELVVDSIIDQFVTLSAYGVTDIPVTYVRSDAYLEDACGGGYGLHYIELDGDADTLLQLAGNIKEVVNKTPFSELQLVQGTAQKITIDEYAKDSHVLVDINTRVEELDLDVATKVGGRGDIGNLNIGAAGCEVDILPDKVFVRSGITATVDGEVIGSTEAAELSAEPRFLADYPKVGNLTPTQAEGLYSVNKPGTIYWAVSELANGSVDVEELITNPAYGGNIFNKQSGDITASARTEYGRAITGLEPDGSYYLSAIMEDGRGNRSPLKVISFTTPDDTKPELINRRISRETCEVVQFTGMANKSCTLYWVLLPAGAAAPTAQIFKSGSFGGHYGSGSMSVVKNVPVSIQVNYSSVKLQEDTDYALYVWLNDFDGAQSSEVYKLDVHTPDETPPVVTNIMQTNFDLPDAIEFIFAINEAPSTLYWAVVTESNETFIAPDADLNSSRTQLKVANGTKAGAIASGSMAASGANLDTQVLAAAFANALKYATYHTHNFKLYYVAKDNYENYSEVKYIVIHTKDTEPPIVTLDDTGTMDGKYPADSDLRLIFSEQVTGGTKEGEPTFVDLYNEVLAKQAAGGAALDAAKDALAKTLAAHIELWYRPRNVTEGDDVQLKEPSITLGDGDTSSTDKYGWIKWSEATVVLQSDGTVILTLPGSGDNQAVQLGSGMDYYFRFKNVYDNSYDHNRLAVTDDKGNIIDGGGTDDTCELSFSTVYATVWLSRDRSGISNTNEGEPDKGVPLDIVFDVTPDSTSNMANTEYWDMVIWNTNNVPCKFVVYRSADDGANWERVTVNQTIDKNDAIDTNETDTKLGEATIYGEDMTAVSLNHYKYSKYITKYGGQYETVVSGLKQGSTYKYAIHFTQVGNSSDREAWTRLIKMEIKLVAGERGNLRTLADDVYGLDGTYKRLVDTEKVLSEISAVKVGSDTLTYLEVEKQFTDDNSPKFWNDYPTLKATSSTITLGVALDRPGNVYYVVAPADGTIPTSMPLGNGTVPITSKNDGSAEEDPENVTAEGDQPSVDNKTYIPKNGADITAVYDTDSDGTKHTNAERIHFADYGNRSVNDRKYTSPAFGSIFSGDYNDPEGIIKKGSVTYTTSARIERITGLQPETWYYVYMVLRSDSNKLDEVVQIYRVKTTEAQPPTFSISHNTTTASIEVWDPEATSSDDRLYDNPDLYYAIVRKNDLPEWFSWQYQWTDKPSDKDETEKGGGPYKTEAEVKALTGAVNVMTVLDAMISTVQTENGKTYFDLYAHQFDNPENASSENSLKYEVMSYITRANANDKYGGSMAPYELKSVNKHDYVYDKHEDMKPGGEYVMLVCARHHDKPADELSAYGFGATQGLFLPDNVPPELISDQGIVEVRFTAIYAPTDPGKKSNMVNWTSSNWRQYSRVDECIFSGTITIEFDKEIYISQGGALKQVVGTVTKQNEQVSLLSLINGASSGSSTTPSEGSSTTTSSGFTAVSASANNRRFTLTFTDLTHGEGFTLAGLSNASGTSNGKTLSVRFDAMITQADVNAAEGDDSSTSAANLLHRPAFRVAWAVRNT